jgi:phage antirepressor YoqD-like protein
MEQEIIKLYKEKSFSINDLCQKFRIGKLKIKKILLENNIKINKKGGQKKTQYNRN